MKALREIGATASVAHEWYVAFSRRCEIHRCDSQSLESCLWLGQAEGAALEPLRGSSDKDPAEPNGAKLIL